MKVTMEGQPMHVWTESSLSISIYLSIYLSTYTGFKVVLHACAAYTSNRQSSRSLLAYYNSTFELRGRSSLLVWATEACTQWRAVNVNVRFVAWFTNMTIYRLHLPSAGHDGRMVALMKVIEVRHAPVSNKHRFRHGCAAVYVCVCVCVCVCML
jgi:hypothetical protein